MPIRQVLYLSRAVLVEDGELQRILHISRRNNRKRDVTGCLLFSGAHFAQAIEGSTDQLDRLIETISRDPRHENVTVIMDRQCNARKFPNWEMGYLFKLELAERIESICGGQAVSEAEALELLEEMDVDTLLGPL